MDVFPESIRNALEYQARCRPGSTACVVGTQQWSYGELDAHAEGLAAALHRRGVVPGDRVLAAVPNSYDMVCLYFAVAKLGAVMVFVNPQFEDSLFTDLVRSIEPRAVVLDDANMAKLSASTQAAVGVRVSWPGEHVARGGNASLRAMLTEGGAAFPRPSICFSDPAQYIFTSGTTGLPKACMLSHRARLALVGQINRCLGVTASDRFFACLPNSHGNVFLGILGAVLAGASFALADRFSASSFWQQVRDSASTILVLHGVPLNILLSAQESADDRRHQARAVITIGGRPAEFLQRFGVERALIGYGSTETGGLASLASVTLDEATQLAASYAGQIRDDIEIRIAGGDDDELPLGQTGEILVRPTRASVISDGFCGLADKTLEGRRNLWLHTGDLGFRAEGNQLHFLGRAREAIRVGGEFVPVEYLESLIRKHAAVEECALVGVPAKIGEDEMLLFVQVKESRQLSEQEVLDYLRGKVPKFMLPRRIAFIAEFPRAAGTLKIQKNRLLALQHA